jgi:uncharacterized RDD family membrane protein YckC
MGAIKVPTNFNIELEFEIPEFYRRMIALLIDIIIEILYFRLILVNIIESMSRKSNPFDGDEQFNINALVLILFLPIMVYHLVCELVFNGQSLGKKIMSLRVVDEKGGKASISQFVIRWLLRVSDLWAVVLLILLLQMAATGRSGNVFILLLGLGFLITDIVLVVSSKKGQRIGDILAHTILIRTNTRSSIEETVFQEVADSYVPSFPEIMRLSDKDINAIKSILETARKKGDFNMAANASEKIKSHLRIDSAMSPFDFMEVLLKDYNYLSTK